MATTPLVHALFASVLLLVLSDPAQMEHRDPTLQGGATCEQATLLTQGSGLVQARSALNPKGSAAQTLKERPGQREHAPVDLADGSLADGSLMLKMWHGLKQGMRTNSLPYTLACGALGASSLMIVSCAAALIFAKQGHADGTKDPKVDGTPKMPPPRSPTITVAKASKSSSARGAPQWQLSLPIVQAVANAADAEKGKGVPLVASTTLCPGLVVPSDCECKLSLPSAALGGGPRAAANPEEPNAGASILDVVAPGGEIVMQCTASTVDWSISELRPSLVLHTPGSSGAGILNGDIAGEAPSSLLAYCKVGSDSDGYRSAYLYNAQHELLAQVASLNDDPPSFVLESGRTRMIFQGDFDAGSVKIVDEQGDVLAVVQAGASPSSSPASSSQLHASSSVDMGAVLCGLFVIGQLRSG